MKSKIIAKKFKPVMISLMKIRVLQQLTEATMLCLTEQSWSAAWQLITHVGASNHLITVSSLRMTENVP